VGRRGKNEILRCSFCGKSQEQVKNLIAGPSFYICNECVEICDEIIADHRDYEQRHGPPSGQGVPVIVPAEPRVRCSMCRNFVLMAEALPIAERGQLCPDCTAAILAALDEAEGLHTER